MKVTDKGKQEYLQEVSSGKNSHYYKLTQPQNRIWYTQQLYLESSMFNIGGCVCIYGKIDTLLLSRAILHVINANDAFHIRLLEKDGDVVQYFCNEISQRIDYIDFSGFDEPSKQLKSWEEEIAGTPFEMINMPLYYFSVYKLDEYEYGYFIKLHHILADGWSVQLMIDYIKKAYEELVADGKAESVPAGQYRYFIKSEEKYFQTERYLRNKKYWLDKFNQRPEKIYEIDGQSEGKRKIFILSEEKSERIRKYVHENEISSNSFFIMVYEVYLHKFYQLDDTVIGIPVIGRINRTERNTIGMFVNSLAFRCLIDENMTIKQFAKYIFGNVRSDFMNQKYPYNSLVNELSREQDILGNLYDVSINYYGTSLANNIAGKTVENIEFYNGQQPYSMQIIIREWDSSNAFQLDVDYKTSKFQEEEINRMVHLLNNIIDKVLLDDQVTLKKCNILSEEEEKQILVDFNDTHTEEPVSKTIIDLFQEQVQKSPDLPAVSYGSTQITYQELDSRSNQFANYLIRQGLKKGDVVGLVLEHSIETIVSILAVLKAGALYLPIDSTYPIKRINYILDDADVKFLLTNTELAEGVNFQGNMIEVSNQKLYTEESISFESRLHIEDSVYIIYTSGTTGQPKGALITGKGLSNYIIWAKRMYIKEAFEVFPLYSSMAFDLTVTSIFTPIVSGGRIEIYRDDHEEYILYRIFKENKCTVVKLTPSHMRLLNEIDCSQSSVHRMIVGGEKLQAELAKKTTLNFNHRIEIYNEYGPTETVVGCMIYQYDEKRDLTGAVPIGRPADNTQIYILDKNLNPLPEGAEGELYIAGDGVCLGYIKRPELNEEKFIPNPFGEGRIYKTGDIARFISPDCINYTGRLDNQVKINGHRIELFEIEEYLRSYLGIKEILVLNRTHETIGEILVAYYVSEQEISSEDVAKYARETLPHFMIPSFFIHIEKIPLNDRGKINTALLPLPEVSDGIENNVGECTEQDHLLLEIVEEVFQAESLNRNSNFYHMGGDSIKAIQISGKLNNRGYVLKVRDILLNPVFKYMSMNIMEKDAETCAPQEDCTGIILPMPIIEWFFEQELANPEHYNQSILCETDCQITAEQIQMVLSKMIEFHDSLRINYDSGKKKLYYNNKHLEEIPVVSYFDLSEMSEVKRNEEMEQIKERMEGGFQIKTGLLIKAAIFRISDSSQILYLCAHHIVIDGVSWRIIVEDMNTLIRQIQKREKLDLGNKTYSYQNWSKQVNSFSINVTGEIDYWKDEVASGFQFDSYRNPFENKVDKRMLTVSLDRKEFVLLQNEANRAYGTKTNDLLITALVRTIKEFGTGEDVIIEVEGHGRDEVFNMDVSRTVGWFTKMYPIKFSLGQDDISWHIKHVKEKIRKVPNQGVGYGILRYLTDSMPYQEKYIRFNYLGEVSDEGEEPIKIMDCIIEADNDVKNKLTSILDINCIVVNKELHIFLTYDAVHLDEESIKEIIIRYKNAIQMIIEHCTNIQKEEFTPSDFNTVELTDSDFDVLFD